MCQLSLLSWNEKKEEERRTVTAIQERNDVQHRQGRNQSKVNFPHDLLLFILIVLTCIFSTDVAFMFDLALFDIHVDKQGTMYSPKDGVCGNMQRLYANNTFKLPRYLTVHQSYPMGI